MLHDKKSLYRHHRKMSRKRRLNMQSCNVKANCRHDRIHDQIIKTLIH